MSFELGIQLPVIVKLIQAAAAHFLIIYYCAYRSTLVKHHMNTISTSFYSSQCCWTFCLVSVSLLSGCVDLCMCYGTYPLLISLGTCLMSVNMCCVNAASRVPCALIGYYYYDEHKRAF